MEAENMKLAEATTVAKMYAERNGLIWDGNLKIIHTHSWWQVLACEHVFELVSAKGRIIAHIWHGKLYSLEYHPVDPRDNMLPLWAAYPGVNSVSGIWKQSNGEQYANTWHRWFDALSPEAQENYRVKFPEPNDPDLMWTGFYTGFKP
jgi:hypothetical protein